MTDICERLRPCPFCGSEALHREQTITDGSVQCLDCCGKMVKADEPTAVAQWNTRAKQELSEDDVERVARALYERSNPPRSGFKSWPKLRDEQQENFRARARAAIAALQETQK